MLCTRDAGTREALFLPFRTRGLEVEMGKVMPLGGTAQQTGNFGDTQNWVEIPAPSLPSNVTLASYYPQRASPDSQGRGDNEVPTYLLLLLGRIHGKLLVKRPPGTL